MAVFAFSFFCFFFTAQVSAQQNNPYIIEGFVSHTRSFNLDSEAQTASDLANFYGYAIDPMTIINALPLSDDPNSGFVGYYNDDGSALPPDSYGVYQEPIAEVLRLQGVPAVGYSNLGLESLKNYIRSGIPVMCWVVGQTQAGTAVSYTPTSGIMTTVVLYMNTVTVTGYDDLGITIWDNGQQYSRTFSEFESSWGVLGNRSLVIDENTSTQIVAIEPAEQTGDWWNDSLDDMWKADKENPEPENWGSSSGGSDFGLIPEVTPDFNWYDDSFGEDYSGWYWYPDETTEDFTYENYEPSGTGTDAFGSGGYLPAQAAVTGFVGYPQSYTLDCETRSAVDLAAYFGVTINASDFLTHLPKSDDPNEGFVGNYWDPRGHIPPASYGVYQEPVAALLRAYGLSAAGYKNYTWEQLQSEIVSGRPVMVWVAGNTEAGTPVSYTPSNGNTTKVVPYQHTVVVTGYDETSVTIQDGGQLYTRNINTFMLSWQVLENRAIVVN